jgi:acyl-CoA synthetase (AMP-forming)/AMP-acid ligase II
VIALDRVRLIHDIPALQAAARPDAPALAQGETRWTYGAWQAAIETAAARLAEAGVRPGDRLAVIGENGLVQATLIHAASRIGAWPVVLNARLSDREIDTILEHSGARRAAFATDVSVEAEKHAARIGADDARWSPLPAFRFSALREAEPEPVTGDPAVDVAAMIYTSGTTGAPKGVMLTHRNLLHVARYGGARRALNARDRVYAALPISHVFGLASMFLGSIYHGGEVVLISRFDPAEALDLLERGGLTVFQGVPAMYARLLEYAAQAGRPIRAPTLRYLSAGGSPLEPSLRAEVETAFGAALNNGYGMTELSPTVSVTDARLGEADASAGTILDGLDVEIRDPEGRALPAGEVGVLNVRGPTVMRGYYRDPALTAKTIDARGFLDTGDFARLDENARLHIVGRAKDLIIRSGFNVYPEEVEAVLRAHPAVTLAAVVGRPAAGNEEVVAFVQLAPGARPSPGELERWAAERLAPYKRPAEIVALDALPASSTGKVQKAQLRALAAETRRRA